MKRYALVLAVTMVLGGCGTVRLVSDYDEVIDKGIIEFSEQLGAHVKNMGELGGKPEGTYDATLKTYNGLDAKLDVLIARASAASEGKACKIETRLHQKVATALKNQIPVELPQGADANTATSASCNARLLLLVKEQLQAIRELHRDVDKCGPQRTIPCLRPATAKDAMAIMHQSVNAVSIVEMAKKSQ